LGGEQGGVAGQLQGNEREKKEDEAMGILVFSDFSDESRGIFCPFTSLLS
jgi:hypothetical protein